jgi:protein-L-isoaspartate O-methyltransferase
MAASGGAVEPLGPTLAPWLGEPTELMLDLAREGSRVLDVAAGAGGQTLAAARRVGPSGAVLATEIALDILEYAADGKRGRPRQRRDAGDGRRDTWSSRKPTNDE